MIQQVAKTPAQLRSQPGDQRLPRETQLMSYQDLRAMRKHPTIAIVRRLIAAPMLASAWSVESNDYAPEGAKDFVDAQMQRWRSTILRAASRAVCDYGWQGFELVYGATEKGNTLELVKPLLQSMTTILVDKKTGDFLGYEQTDADGRPVIVQGLECLRVTFDLEGTYWYGTPRLEAAKQPWTDWRTIAAANDRYDTKVAGSSWVIHYPQGRSDYNGQEQMDNYDIAIDLLSKLQASGAIVVPQTMQERVDELNADSPRAWKIELISDGVSPQYSFVARMKYLDALMARAVGLPERAILEGQFGTKAEAGEHADFAITDVEMTHDVIVEEVNFGPVDTLLRLNYGEEAVGTVRVKAAPLSSERKKQLRLLYEKFLSSPETLALEVDRVDMSALRDQLEIPYLSDEDREDELPAMA